MTYRISSPTGEVRTGLTKEDVSDFKNAKLKKGIDPKAAGYKIEVEDFEEESSANQEPESSKTSYEDRKNAFRRVDERILSEVFPNIAEQVMNGNQKFDLGMIRAGLSDAFSLPGRAVSAYMSSMPNMKGERDTFDLGRRTGEGTNIAGTIARDPVTGATVLGGRLLARGIQGGARLGKFLLGGGGFGRGVGGAVAGAAEGVGIEGASSALNDRDFTKEGAVVGAVSGGAFEGLGQAAQALLQKYGKNLVKSSVQALNLGNTDRALTDEELVRFLSNQRNVDALEKTLDAASSGRNMTPFVNDRGKALEGVLEQSRNDAIYTLVGEPSLNRGFDKGVDFSNPTSGDMQRRMNAFNTPAEQLETIQPKTVYKEGGRSTEELNYPPPRKFTSRKKPNDNKDYRYQSNAEFNIEKFADKWASVSDKIDGANVRPGDISADEAAMLDLLKEEAEKDARIVKGYTPDKVISSNKFLNDRNPFSTGFVDKDFSDFIASKNREGLSTEFIREVRSIAGKNDMEGRKVTDAIIENIDNRGLRPSEIERAFAYSKNDPIAVRKGYRKAIDRFSDTLSDYADGKVGTSGRNAKGERYVVGKDNMKKYAYTYLARVQEILEKKGALKHEDVVDLYGLATNVNDNTVQDAVIQLLKDLKVSERAISDFEKNAGSYAMLNKARTRMKRNANEDNPFKGTMVAPIYPQEGFNSANAIGYRLQKENFNLGRGAMTPMDNPTKYGQGARAVYNLGMTRYRNRDSKE
jgi:hypothetical protein